LYVIYRIDIFIFDVANNNASKWPYTVVIISLFFAV